MSYLNMYSLVLALCCFCLSVTGDEHLKHGAAGRQHDHDHEADGVHDFNFDKDALYGMRDTEEFAELPEDVRRARLKTLANSHDSNGDGIIQVEELKKWILESFSALDKEEADEKFKEDDEDADGHVTLSEIINQQYGYSQEDVDQIVGRKGTEEGAEEADILETIEDDTTRFKVADLNHDEKLDRDEYQAYYQPYDFPHMHHTEMMRTMRDYDKDKNGVVSFQEFLGENHDDDEDFKKHEMENFEQLDKDRDGSLSEEELKVWSLPNNEDAAESEVKHLVEICDTDKDGHLSIDEIVAKEDEFLSSSATDYGRSLHFVREEL